MGESGSLVQPAGSAAFLSPEMGEQQSRNVPRRERRVISRVKEKRQEATRRKSEKGELDTLLWEFSNITTGLLIKLKKQRKRNFPT